MAEQKNLLSLLIPKSKDEQLAVQMEVGEILFVLGANGTGKSSLMNLFSKKTKTKIRRISAHRQTWFHSDAVSITTRDRIRLRQSIEGIDASDEARFKDHYPNQRADIAIYDLVNAQHDRNALIANAIDKGMSDDAKNISNKQSAPINIINEILKFSNLPIEISIASHGQVVARKNNSEPYSIAELSDGERNALLIAATVLTVEKETLILLDEPERHLHRSIISPLISSLLAKRPDCSFIVSTHDVYLPIDNTGAKILLVRGCNYKNKEVISWDVDLVDKSMNIDEELKKDILGSRQKILFIEGNEQSLDKSLYTLIFQNISVISKSSCRDVERAVVGIRDSSELNWLRAFGIVDNDQRSAKDIAELKTKGVYALDVYSVESIYYHPEIQRRIAERRASVIGGEDASTSLSNAKLALVQAVTPHLKRLSARVVEKSIREAIFQQLPTLNSINDGIPVNIQIDVENKRNETAVILQEQLNAGNIVEIISKYPVRDTPALKEIAQKLGFQGRAQYESAVRKLLVDDISALEFVKTLFGTLSEDIA